MSANSAPSAPPAAAPSPAHAWLAQRSFAPQPFQLEVWAAIAQGASGLLHANTGAGKTWGVWLGLLNALAQIAPARSAAPPITVLWITPMRALAADTVAALRGPMADLAPTWTIGLRTGDTPSGERARQDKRLPTVLVTTPESLTVLISRPDAAERLGAVRAVVVDEWHELIASKRGVQVQLALARLARYSFDSYLGSQNERSRPIGPKDSSAPVVWGLSATLGNAELAMATLCAPLLQPSSPAPQLVRAHVAKPLIIDSLIPPDPGRYAWAGHLGARMVGAVANALDAHGGTALVFTNVRSQAEIWHQMLLDELPQRDANWAAQLALHHGSLDASVRTWVEAGLKTGTLRAVVATSSLDLGVDFAPVDRVLQIGSPKGLARLVQRAGRSGHSPGRPSRITLVPAHTWELIEAVAARRAVAAGHMESRSSPHKPLDVLVQHIVTVALGGGFTPEALLAELRSTHCYRDLSADELAWAIGFCEHGGSSLAAYPEYHRIAQDAAGIYRVSNPALARRHRMSIGTIVSEANLKVSFLNGQTIGTVEEGFAARLKKGDCFVFAGRVLQFVRLQELTVWVQRATKPRGIVPSWQGSRMSMSGELADAVLALLAQVQAGDAATLAEPEIVAALPLVHTQQATSKLPLPGRLLVESWQSTEGWHLFVYPFAGRSVHLGLANLLAWRLTQQAANTFSLSVNDFGLELLAAQPLQADIATLAAALQTGDVQADVLSSLNASELSQRRFREVARIGGLVHTGMPGAQKTARQLQASSGLFFEVFKKYDPGNLLLAQAEREALLQDLQADRLHATLQRLADMPIDWVQLPRPSPLCVPLMVERFREQWSNEQLQTRLARLLAEAGEAAAPGASHSVDGPHSPPRKRGKPGPRGTRARRA